MIQFLPSVGRTKIHPAIWIAMGIAFRLRSQLTMLPMVITSMNDGAHTPGLKSYHYPDSTPSGLCQAVDIRTIDISPVLRSAWAVNCTTLLNTLGYDVIHHIGQDSFAPHLHIEYQPKADEHDWAKEAIQ